MQVGLDAATYYVDDVVVRLVKHRVWLLLSAETHPSSLGGWTGGAVGGIHFDRLSPSYQVRIFVVIEKNGLVNCYTRSSPTCIIVTAAARNAMMV